MTITIKPTKTGAVGKDSYELWDKEGDYIGDITEDTFDGDGFFTISLFEDKPSRGRFADGEEPYDAFTCVVSGHFGKTVTLQPGKVDEFR